MVSAAIAQVAALTPEQQRERLPPHDDVARPEILVAQTTCRLPRQMMRAVQDMA